MPRYLQVTGINPDLLLEILPENVGDLDGLFQNTTVSHSRGQIRPGAGILELFEVDVLSDIVSIPVSPPLRADNIAQVAVLEDDAGVRAPGAAQVCGALASCPSDRGPVEDVIGRAFVGFASAGRDEPGPDRLDVAALEPGLSVAAKDEVDGAVDVAVGVELATLVAEDCVLVAWSGASVYSWYCRLRWSFSPVKLTP